MTLLNVHDKFFKQAFSHPDVVRDFVATLFPAEVSGFLRLDTLALVNNSFVDETLSEHFADLVYACDYQTVEGTKGTLQVALLFEHKSYVVAQPHFQLLRYLLNAWEADQKEGNAPRLLIPIVVYHGTATWQYDSLASYFPGIQPPHLRFLPQFDYLLQDLSGLPDEAIMGFKNRFLALSALLLKHSREKAYLQKVGAQVADLIHLLEREDRNFLQSVVVYLYNTHSAKDQSQVLNLLKSISSQTTQLTMTIYESILLEGVVQGKLEGKLENQTETVRNLILLGKLNDAEIAACASVTVDFVRQVRSGINQG